ncbi:MAG: hypothetical protein MPI93_01775 [Nitrosopumilus sp.]|nr:hypothetical protein [Nitrosopumilus sp.]
MNIIKPLSEDGWKNLMDVMERGPTKEQREMYRDSEKVFRETRWGDGAGSSGGKPPAIPQDPA